MQGSFARKTWRAGWVATLLASSALFPALPAFAQQQGQQQAFSIPAGPLETALPAFGRQAGRQISAPGELVAGVSTQGVTGQLSTEQALSRLLAGTGLTYTINSASITIVRAPQGATVLGPVRIEGAAEQTGGSAGGLIFDPGRSEGSQSYAAPASTTALKFPLTPRETPQTVQTITSEVIKDFNLTNTEDILQFSPGVYVQNERNTEAYWFLARGFEMQTQIDGAKSAVLGGRGGNSPDAAFLDRVDILQGASGLLAGAGSPGGTINLVRKTPGAEFETSLEAGVDTFGGYRLVGDVGGPTSLDGLGARLIGVFEENQLYIDHASSKEVSLYGVIESQIGERTVFLAGATYREIFDASLGAHYGNPTNPDGSLLDIPRELNLGATWGWQSDQQYSLFGKLQHDFGGGWNMQALLNYETTDFSALESVPGQEETLGLRLFSQFEGWENENIGIDVYAQGPFDLFGRTHELMFGMNGAKWDWQYDDYRYGLDTVASIDPATWDPRNGGDPYSIAYGADNWGTGTNEQIGGFAAGRFSIIDPLHVIVGARVTSVSESYSGVEAYSEDGVVTPYGAVTWDFSKNFTAYASYSDIFQPHGSWTIDATGSILDPIIGENLEAGLKYEAFDGALNASVAIFQLDQTNLAEEDFGAELPGRCGGPTLDPCYRATGLVRSQGFDVTIAGKIADGWQIIGGYNYLDQQHETGPSAGLRYDTLAPEHKVNLALSYTSPDNKWNAGVSARYMSEVFAEGALDWDLDNDGSLETAIPYRIQQDEHVVVGLFGRYNFTGKMSLHAAIQNATDEKYLSGISWPVHGNVWGDPVSASLTLRIAK